MTIRHKECKNNISYIHQIYSRSSFNIVSSNHIKYLRMAKDDLVTTGSILTDSSKDIEIQEIDWSMLENIALENNVNVLLHPILHLSGSPGQFSQNSGIFSRLLDIKHKIGGFDVADSDKMSSFSVEIFNKLDLIMVPSNWSREAYVNSGVKSPVEVLPHGISDKFSDNNTVTMSDKITEAINEITEDVNETTKTINKNTTKIKELKEHGNILILYFMLHSSYRKGADLVTEVMKRIQSKSKNVYLVFKSPGVLARECPGVNGIGLRDWINEDDLRSLYDSCDICICPSRGGGFELNALEASSRGIPTLVPNGGCFLDYIDYLIPVDLSNKKIKLFDGNPIHVGNGFEVDIDDFEEKLTDTINNLEKYKSQFRRNSKGIRDKLSWRSTAKTLEEYLRKYEFID